MNGLLEVGVGYVRAGEDAGGVMPTGANVTQVGEMMNSPRVRA